MTKKKKEYYEKKIIVEVPDENIESVTTVSSTDEKVSVVFTEDPDPTLVRLTELEERIESIEKQEYLAARTEDLERALVDLRSELEDHTQHLPSVGPSATPRRHDTYEVKEDGEKLAKIAKKLWGVSGRYVEIAALNSITDATNLIKGQILKLPK